ncbi:hypothetical protein C6988_07005 [Nitrosopumilus sp. b1]|uniref:2OG-Fe(II)-dependent halogenase WelO5 family protein n=1 Tax=Nitrosopumilus sp. b1 TaxID=2109907 RepID=UPI0015F35EC2|nr:2OG-Fe(II) oxygenase [Nitrosopumilus sp. b1]KAF6242910.1 hypothetical protein C6988_07005 [Nitrosopumilus sp. b1]
MWNPIIISVKDKKLGNALNLLKSADTPALVLKNFFPKESCDIVSSRVTEYFSKNKCGNNKKIGISLVSLRNDKENYFKMADAARSVIRNIFHGMQDPRKKIHSELKEILNIDDISIAKEKDSRYACGVIRIHDKESESSLHRDNVSFEAPHFSVSNLKSQLSFVLPFQSPDKGGELQLFHQRWKEKDEKFRRVDFGYYDEVIMQNVESVKISPTKGDLMVINPNLYHRIQPVVGEKLRITLNMFAGFLPNKNEILTWS